MSLKRGSEEEFEKWRLKMLNAKRTNILESFAEVCQLLESGCLEEKVAEKLAKVKLKTKIKLKDLGYLALAISAFHERGAPFRFNWNKFWQGEDWALDMELSEKRVFDPYGEKE
ncbi:MAG: hypothetical protein Q7S73_02570 [bacterium]|nr:hypothetical protein [bacterium]